MATSAAEPLAAAVKAARSLGLRDAQVSVTALERACAELQRLTDELDAANSSSDRAWGREHELLQRITQLETTITRAQAAVAALKQRADADPTSTSSLATHEAAVLVEKALADLSTAAKGGE